ncbi:MAG: LOG family protein [Alphaproteobacteria bacterium]|nr:LOG family protein [Alphaproteobacteria bacterium]MCW5741382.1 LOG family protein [Alphaproteobacteria bacterium]
MTDDGKPQVGRPGLLAVDDSEFLKRDELRGIRFALEYERAELALRGWGVRSTVIAFGSARIPSPEMLRAAGEGGVQGRDARQLDRLAPLARYYDVAREFGRIVSQRGGALDRTMEGRHNVIATGGGPGIMEAANRGAADVGAPSIGFNIALPHEQAPNPYSTPELTFHFHYFAMRKMHLAMRARALAVFPGGFGTFDELFEILTLQQTGKGHQAIVVLIGGEFWRDTVGFDALASRGLIDAGDLALFRIVDTAEEAWAYLVERGLLEQAASDITPLPTDEP